MNLCSSSNKLEKKKKKKVKLPCKLILTLYIFNVLILFSDHHIQENEREI